MKTELLMTVGYIFYDRKAIVGGADPHYSTTDLGWLNIMEKEVFIQTVKGELYFKVKKVDIFTSIGGALNIGLTLDADGLFDAIDRGDKVFKVIDD